MCWNTLECVESVGIHLNQVVATKLSIIAFLDPVGSLVSILLVSWLLVVGCWLSHLPKLVNLECVGILWNVWKVLEYVGMG